MVPILNLFQIKFPRLPNQTWVKKFEIVRVQGYFFKLFGFPETCLPNQTLEKAKMVSILNLFQFEFPRLPNQTWVKKFEIVRVQGYFIKFYWFQVTCLSNQTFEKTKMVPILNIFQIEFPRLPNQPWLEIFESARVQSFFWFLLNSRNYSSLFELDHVDHVDHVACF